MNRTSSIFALALGAALVVASVALAAPDENSTNPKEADQEAPDFIPDALKAREYSVEELQSIPISLNRSSFPELNIVDENELDFKLGALRALVRHKDATENQVASAVSVYRSFIQAREIKKPGDPECRQDPFLKVALERFPESWSVKYAVADATVNINEIYDLPTLPKEWFFDDALRVLRLRIFEEALPLMRAADKTNPNVAHTLYRDKAEAYRAFIHTLMRDRFSFNPKREYPTSDFEKLQYLTPTEKNPANPPVFERSNNSNPRARSPIDSKTGAVLVFTTPQSYETAKNDGERVMALLAEMREFASAKELFLTELEIGRVMQDVYGVAALTKNKSLPTARKKELEKLVVGLKDGETIAFVDGKFETIELAPECNPIKRLRDALEIALKNPDIEYAPKGFIGVQYPKPEDAFDALATEYAARGQADRLDALANEFAVAVKNAKESAQSIPKEIKRVAVAAGIMGDFQARLEKANDSDEDFVKALEAIQKRFQIDAFGEKEAMLAFDDLKRVWNVPFMELTSVGSSVRRCERSEVVRKAFEETAEMLLDACPDSWSLRYRVVNELPMFGELNVRGQVPKDVDAQDVARVRKLQRLVEILPILENAPDYNQNYPNGPCAYRANCYVAMIDLLNGGAINGGIPLHYDPNRRRLYLNRSRLTPLDADATAKPKPDVPVRELLFTPHNADGEPLFYSAPEKFEDAKNDGERANFIRNRLAKLDKYDDRVAFDRVDEAYSLFSVDALGQLTAEEVALLPELEDNQTIARLPSGSRVVDLPPEYAFIPIAFATLNDQSDYKLSRLESEFKARRQFGKLANLYDEYVKNENVSEVAREEAKRRREALEKIDVNFDLEATSVKGPDVAFGVKTRNVEKLEFVVRKIDLDQFVARRADAKDSPNDVPSIYREMQSAVLDELYAASGGAPKILGDEVARFAVKIDSGVESTLQTVKLDDYAKLEPGAYYVKAIANEEEREAVFILQNAALALYRVPDGNQYLCVDPKTGEPLAGVKIQFVALDGKKVYEKNGDQFTSRTEYASATLELTTDERGIVRLERDEFVKLGLIAPGRQGAAYSDSLKLLAIARDADGAFLGALDFVKPNVPIDPASMAGVGFCDVGEPEPIVDKFPTNATYAVFDQTYYRPGDKARFVLFRQSNEGTWKDVPIALFYALDDDSRAPRMTPKTERVLLDEKVDQDEFGVVSGSFTVPKNARGQIRVELQSGPGPGLVGYINVVPNRELARVEIDAPKAPVARDALLDIPVRAFLPSGEPAANRAIGCDLAIRTDYNREGNEDADWNWFYGNGYDKTDLFVGERCVRDGYIPTFAPIKPLFHDESFNKSYALTTDDEGRATLRLDLGEFQNLDPKTPYRVNLRALLPRQGDERPFVTREADAFASFPVAVAKIDVEKSRGALELARDRAEYKPGDVAKITIVSSQPDAFVYLTPRSYYGELRGETKLVQLQDGRGEFYLPIEEVDSPNAILLATTVFDAEPRSALIELPVPPSDRLLDGKLAVERDGENAKISVRIAPNDAAPKRVYFSVYDASLDKARGAFAYDQLRETFVKWSRFSIAEEIDALDRANFAVVFDQRNFDTSKETIAALGTGGDSRFFKELKPTFGPDANGALRSRPDGYRVRDAQFLRQRFRGERRSPFRELDFVGAFEMNFRDEPYAGSDALDPSKLKWNALESLKKVDVDKNGEASITVSTKKLLDDQRVRAWFLDDKGRVGCAETLITKDE